jgi:hypothetical protein
MFLDPAGWAIIDDEDDEADRAMHLVAASGACSSCER